MEVVDIKVRYFWDMRKESLSSFEEEGVLCKLLMKYETGFTTAIFGFEIRYIERTITHVVTVIIIIINSGSVISVILTDRIIIIIMI